MAKTRACDGFAEDYSALLDGELGAGRAAQMRAHVEGCGYCESELEALRNVDAMLRAAPAPEVSSDLRARLQVRIDEERALPAAVARRVRGLESRDTRLARTPRRPRFGIRPAVGIGAAAAVAAGVALILLQPGTRKEVELPPIVVAATDEKTPLPALPAEPLEAPEIQVAVEPEIPIVPEPALPEEIPDPVPELLADEPAAPEAIVVAEEIPVTPEPVVAATQPSVEPTRDPLDLDGSSDSEFMEIAVVLELDTLVDLDVIANLELLERLIALEEGTG